MIIEPEKPLIEFPAAIWNFALSLFAGEKHAIGFFKRWYRRYWVAPRKKMMDMQPKNSAALLRVGNEQNAPISAGCAANWSRILIRISVYSQL
ncbi:hypothetical protein BB776_03900 [Planococcus salinarum]|uniref:Uncharacterized protein n=1 Tax=Planococcus salinarum TaxID=622695 RepID=A0ABX3CYH5_9BACL|nr:hypothetical protein [Planococcus salinarum]OHX50571.1 hypothetical protein BB776_03900 [Planococcus salinarum]